jgi:hypothetical protein
MWPPLPDHTLPSAVRMRCEPRSIAIVRSYVVVAASAALGTMTVPLRIPDASTFVAIVQAAGVPGALCAANATWMSATRVRSLRR